MLVWSTGHSTSMAFTFKWPSCLAISLQLGKILAVQAILLIINVAGQTRHFRAEVRLACETKLQLTFSSTLTPSQCTDILWSVVLKAEREATCTHLPEGARQSIGCWRRNVKPRARTSERARLSTFGSIYPTDSNMDYLASSLLHYKQC